MKQRLKRWLFSLLGKDSEAVILVLKSGEAGRAAEMEEQMRALVPDRRYVVIEPAEGETAGEAWLRMGRELRGLRVALAATLFDGSSRGAALRRAAFWLFPRKILAFNRQLERQHLRLGQGIASLLFLCGLPKDRIFLRPKWLYPYKSDRSAIPVHWHACPARGYRAGFPRVAIVSPYCPMPLSHGGAVRLYNLLREGAKEFDIALFAFKDGQTAGDLARLAPLCAELRLAPKPRWREPRWSTLLPPEAGEFHNIYLDRALHEYLKANSIWLLQAEYTQMSAYRPDVLVEHDITFDLFEQVYRSERRPGAWWDWYRWKRFERRALREAKRVVAMSEKDAALVRGRRVEVIPNGVDLERFRPEAETPGHRLLFVGSFRHFPNVRAYRFLVEEVWPLVAGEFPWLRLAVVAGPQPELYWPHPAPDPRIELKGFVADVRPLYAAANVVVVPTVVSAGTNLKALEAMATERAMVSTPSGVAGLGLEHGEGVWIGQTAEEFAEGLRRLLGDPDLRRRMAVTARRLAEERYGWAAIGQLQARLWRELIDERG